MAQNSTNYCSQPILGQLLSFIPSSVFAKSVHENKSDKWYKRLKTWDHFVFMFYAVLTGSSTIREVIKNFALMGTKLCHCGIFSLPKRSTLSDANANRGSSVFGHLYISLYLYYKSYLSDSYLSMDINGEVSPSQVDIFDSTIITLFKDVFKACGRLPKDGRKKGGLKAFSKITLSERVPNFICMKSASTNEKVFLSSLGLSKGTIAVFDKGFQKFKQYKDWNDHGVFYVTRLNDNARFKVIVQRDLGEGNAHMGIHMDADIELSYLCEDSKSDQTVIARMIAYRDPYTGEKLVFLTNLFELKAMTICLLYKNRWTIEPLFKQIKQNFELTYFLSDSEEGIKTQVWMAFILNLVFTVIHKMAKEAEDFGTMVKLAAKNTASYVSFIKFLKDPTIMLKRLNDEIIKKIQYELFEDNQGGGFFSSA